MLTVTAALLLASAALAPGASALPSAALLKVIPSNTVYNLSAEHKHLFHPSSPPKKRSSNEERSCGSYNTAAQGTAVAMQNLYYNTGGYYQGGSGGGSAWTDVVSPALISYICAGRYDCFISSSKPSSYFW